MARAGHARKRRKRRANPAGARSDHGDLPPRPHFLDALQLFIRLVNIGDAKSQATHPASTTRRQLSAQELNKAGVNEDTVRLPVGIEHIDDPLPDLDQVLKAV